MMIMFGEYQILILLRDKNIILTKPPLTAMSGVVINRKTKSVKCSVFLITGTDNNSILLAKFLINIVLFLMIF